MAFQKLSLAAAWPGSAQYTAAAETEIRLVNSHGDIVYWVTTATDTVPDLPEQQASPIHGGQVEDVTLLANERLWIAAPWLGNQSVDVTLMY